MIYIHMFVNKQLILVYINALALSLFLRLILK